MYLDFTVPIPDVKGKITYRTKREATYVYYEYGRIYNPEKQYTTAQRVTIGKRVKDDPTAMLPNENYLKYFPGAELPEEKDRSKRSSCLRIGAYIVIQKILKESGIPEILRKYFNERDTGIFLDFVSYSIVAENNAAQYYPDYAYHHALFTNKMKIYSDAKLSEFFRSMTVEQSVGFLNEWNTGRDHREKVYLSYDSTNKNCQAGNIELLEYGHAKENPDVPIFNYAIAYDTKNREPLFYEAYPGSINDVSQLQFMVNKVHGYGYKKIGFILDRGYFSRKNIEYMDECGYSFVIMVRGMAAFVNELVLEHKGSFENKRACSISEYHVYGMTVKRKLYETDSKERYIHIYHSIDKESSERGMLETKIDDMTRFLKRHMNEFRDFGSAYEHYFELYRDEEDGRFLFPAEKTEVIEREINLCGYFCIITSEKMAAKEAIRLYKSRDASEKLFRGDKSYLGNHSLRVQSNESAEAKIFIEFVALIVRNRIYTQLKEELKNLDNRPNYMTVPAAIRELEKIEMVRQLDGVYRLDHAVTAIQKNILKAFGLSADSVKYRAAEISDRLRSAEQNHAEG